MPCLIEPIGEAEFQAYYDLRWRLLRAPLGQPRGSERDELEQESYHLLTLTGDRTPVGVGRLHLSATTEARIRYMAVEPDYQGRGIGGRILAALEKKAQGLEVRTIWLDARDMACRFYEWHGYRAIRETHRLYDTIQHYRMEKSI